MAAARKIKIAEIPEEAKKIIRGVDSVYTFVEGHFRDICKLSDPHIIAILCEIPCMFPRNLPEAKEKNEKRSMYMYKTM